jgi:hypothetical protein
VSPRSSADKSAGYSIEILSDMSPSGDQFLSQEITVKTGHRPGIPVAFLWRGKEYHIQEIWGEWPDYGFGSTQTGRWWQRRHRTYFRVVTEEKEVFDIYIDRGSKRKQWYLYRRVGASSGPVEED